MPIVWEGNTIELKDVVSTLPLARSYQRVDELGVDFFKYTFLFHNHYLI